MSGGLVQQVHRLELPPVKHREVVERTGQGLGLGQAVHPHQGQRDPAGLAERRDFFHTLVDKGALGVVVDGQLLAVDDPPFGARREAGEGAVQGESQQLITGLRGIGHDKAEPPGEGLVREPRLLLLRPQHAHAGFSLCPGVGQAGLQQRPAVSLPLVGAGDPQAVDVEVVVPHHRHPGRLQGGILDEDRALLVQLAEHVPLPEPLRQPPPLFLHPRVGLFAADDAAQVLVRQILRRQVDKVGGHGMSPPKEPSTGCRRRSGHSRPGISR